MIEETTLFRTVDGTLHNTRQKAVAHERVLELKDWYEDNKIYGNSDGCKIEWETLLEWLEDNKEAREILVSLS